MLHLPDVIHTNPVRDLNLLQAFHKDAMLRALIPRLRILMLIKQTQTSSRHLLESFLPDNDDTKPP